MYHVNIGMGTVTYFLCLLEDNDLKDTICIQTWPSQHEGLLGTTRTMSLRNQKQVNHMIIQNLAYKSISGFLWVADNYSPRYIGKILYSKIHQTGE